MAKELGEKTIETKKVIPVPATEKQIGFIGRLNMPVNLSGLTKDEASKAIDKFLDLKKPSRWRHIHKWKVLRDKVKLDFNGEYLVVSYICKQCFLMVDYMRNKQSGKVRKVMRISKIIKA